MRAPLRSRFFCCPDHRGADPHGQEKQYTGTGARVNFVTNQRALGCLPATGGRDRVGVDLDWGASH